MTQPVELGPNQPRQFYRGGDAIAELRGAPRGDGYRPEDWVGSTTPRFGLGPDGLATLPDGRYLRDAIEADPEGWLGPRHAGYFGSSPALLVKLLDAGQRLPVHVHPDRSFAWRHLGSRHGKTEAWLVAGTRGADPAVYLGWSRDVEHAELARWVAEQDVEAMLGTLHKLSVRPGDGVLVPAGTPHAIGEGVFSVELQEPTDFSVMLEMKGFDIDPSGGELGLGRDLAISCVRAKAFGADEVEHLRRTAGGARAGSAAVEPVDGYLDLGPADHGGPSVEDALPEAANPYFRAQRVRGDGAKLDQSFAVVIGMSGAGRLRGEGWQVSLGRGTTLVVPWGAGASEVEGRVELLRCLPPLAADASTDDPTANAAAVTTSGGQ